MGGKVLLDDPSEVTALKPGLEDQNGVVFGFGEVVGQHVHVVVVGIEFFGVGGGVFAVVDDLVDVGLGEDNGLDLPAEGLFEDVVFGEVDCFVGVVGGVEFGLGWKEDIIGDAGWGWEYLLKEY